MKNTFRTTQTLLITLLILLFYSCNKDEPKIIKEKVTGHVQKGPYINGTSISMSELNSSLAQTGKIFTAQISNNSGSFEIKNISLTSSYVEFSASGFYFDEVKGVLSIAPLNLYALSDITDISTVNVNILTHLEKLRVEYLVEHNKTFSEAKKIAQGEILAIFGFSLSGMDNSEELDISVNNEGNAILLAISIILQGNRSVGDLTELLANISNDIREDGILNSESILTSLRNSAKELVLTTIRSNLVNRYQELGISASIPGFEKYANNFLVFTGEKPVTTTQAATNITTTSATLNGVVNANSLSTTVTFEYGTAISFGSSATATQSPVIGSDSVNASIGITGLLPNTIYHFRVKAENALGITYGNDVSFTTQNGVVTLSTTSITSITATSASSGGSITADGGASITARGVCYSINQNPTIADSKTTDGAGTGSFTSAITGLTPGAIYYFRAYATNSIGTAYGNQVTATATALLPAITTTALSAITATTATSGGNITSDGGAAVTARGVCYSTNQNPTIADSKTTDGAGTGSFTSSITGLTPGATYYFRAYATNSIGTAYGSEITTTTTAILPTITTTTLSAITATTATSGGNITSDGGASITARGVCWSTSSNPTTADSKTTNSTGSGSFTSYITGLTPDVTYYFRAYATNSIGTAYGNQLTATTPAILPTITTTALSAITTTTAISGGNITSDGGASVTARGVCWSTSSNPTTADNKTTNGTASGSFTSSITGLTPGATYYFRAYATNSIGTAYGNQEICITSYGTVVDVDDNTYQTVKIGTQIWFRENLKTTKLKDRTSIPLITNNDTWANLSTLGYCWYNNNAVTYKSTYGALYNWYTVNTGKLCPTGWHVPSDAEWTTLTTYLGGESVAGGKLKEVGTTHWSWPNTGATNETGFTALPGGYHRSDGPFEGIQNRSYYWSSSEINSTTAWGRYAANYISTMFRGDYFKDQGFAIRCISGELTLPVLSTTSITNISCTYALSGGNVSSDGGTTITVRGVCWNTSSNPTTVNSITTDGTGIGNFTSSLTGLIPNTTYYVRAYATNSAGTEYGPQVTFTTAAATQLPTITTKQISSILTTTATSGGNISSDGVGSANARGVCWSTTPLPTTSNSKSSDGAGTGSFTSSIAGLSPNTTYYVRAYASNSAGTAYGGQESFTTTTLSSIKISDIDNNVYNTINIGTQVWIVENLKTTKYNDGTAISLVTDNTIWSNLSTPGYCWYNNNALTYKSTYGALYNWYTVNTGKLCPTGWHVPSDTEWTTLTTYLGGESVAGGKLKESGTVHWQSYINVTVANETGFTALPGGVRSNGLFNSIGVFGSWWSSTESSTTNAWSRGLGYSNNNIDRNYYYRKPFGFSVRCLKDY